MAGPSTGTHYQFIKPRAPAPKAASNSFIKFTETLQYGQSPKPVVKKQNSPDFVPLPIPKNNPPIRNASHVTNKPSEPASSKDNGITDLKKKAEPKTPDLIKTMKVATGTVEPTMKWFKHFSSQLMLYEVYANILSIRQGKHSSEKILLLRNSTGPVLQAVFYEIDLKMPNIRNGDLVRCVGRSLDNSRLHILKIKKINAKEMENAARLMAISNFSLNK